jgi:lipoyl(octanoyl) transferase
MPDPWFFIRSGPGDAAFNMALDEVLLLNAPSLHRPVLRFYSWTEPAASFGYFQKFSEVAKLTSLRPLVRRPTGGGIVPHDADWTYSVCIPPAHEWYGLAATASYRRIHEWIAEAFAKMNITVQVAPAARKSAPGQCFIGHEQSDVLWNGRKIAGAAQRRTRSGLLIQGSVQPPVVTPAPARLGWETAMLQVGSAGRQIECEPFMVEGALASSAIELAGGKYSQPAYNQRR